MQLHGTEVRSKFLSGRTVPAIIFEDNYGQWWRQQIEEPYTGYSIQRDPDNTYRFEVREGDRPASDDPQIERAELVNVTGAGGATKAQPANTSLWFAGRLTVQELNAADWCIYAQLRHTEDAGDIGTASPPLAIGSNAAGQLTISTRSSSENPLTINPAEVVRYTGTITPGVPVNLVCNVRIDHAGAGFLRVWRDGVQVVDYAGPLGYNDSVGPYFKAGLYRQTSPTTGVVTWANLECGTADLSGRILNPLP